MTILHWAVHYGDWYISRWRHIQYSAPVVTLAITLHGGPVVLRPVSATPCLIHFMYVWSASRRSCVGQRKWRHVVQRAGTGEKVTWLYQGVPHSDGRRQTDSTEVLHWNRRRTYSQRLQVCAVVEANCQSKGSGRHPCSETPERILMIVGLLLLLLILLLSYKSTNEVHTAE